MSSNRVGVVLPAAGTGRRTGFTVPKQYVELEGVPLLLRTIRKFSAHPEIDRICVVLPPEDHRDPPPFIADLIGDRLILAGGGETRAASVRAGVESLMGGCDVILVHDAARPFVSSDVISAAITRIVETGKPIICAVPVSDTLKRVGENGVVTETVDRSALWRAQTPQGAPSSLFAQAFESVRSWERLTDESSLFELAGLEVEVVPDKASNFKLTTSDDFDLAARVLLDHDRSVRR